MAKMSLHALIKDEEEAIEGYEDFFQFVEQLYQEDKMNDRDYLYIRTALSKIVADQTEHIVVLTKLKERFHYL